MVNKNYKIVGVDLLIAFLSWQFFKYVDYVLNVITPDSFAFDFEVLAVANFIVLASVISLGLAVFSKKRWTLLTAGVVGLIYLLIFGWTYFNWLGIGIIILLFLLARHDGVEEVDQRTKVNSRMIVRRVAPAVITALFVLISFVAYQSPVAKGVAKAERLPSASEQLMRSIVESVIGGQVEAGGQEKENIITQVSNQTIQQFNNILKPYFQYAPPLLAFGLFLILWGSSWIFVQLSVLLGVLIFWILKKTGVVRIEEREVKAEVLEI